MLLAYGMRQDDVISIVVAALFLPFMAQVLGLGLGIWRADWRLASQASLALVISIIISIVADVTVALAFGGPMLLDGFKTPVVSLGISLVIEAAAGLSTADDTGRRYLIGVAAAAQSGVFAVWIGAAAVLGFPDMLTTLARIATLVLNVVAIALAACALYGCLGLRCGGTSYADRASPDAPKEQRQYEASRNRQASQAARERRSGDDRQIFVRSNSHAAKQRTWTWNLSSPGLSPSRAN